MGILRTADENVGGTKGEGIVLRTFENGKVLINNVPYQKEETGEEFLPYHILYRLSEILKYMEKEGKRELCYQKFVGEDWGKMNSGGKEDKIRSKDEVIKYVLEDWLEKYYEEKLKATTEGVSKDWLNYFYEKLSQLPDLHREIIERKYLKKDYDGRYPLDEIVYNEMHIARGSYYIRKKEALYWLGLGLKGGDVKNKR